MAKPEQQKFYAPTELMDRFGEVLKQQGLSNSEGITRLIRLATNAPESLVPLLFDQVQGEAAAALARLVLRRGGKTGVKLLDTTALKEAKERR